ncbi:MAG TPA: phosphoglycerate mutase [Rhodanobacteraceae bacterium]|nr:phosphoglycerate mutase [Rhodanobacteraceae bacterium]
MRDDAGWQRWLARADHLPSSGRGWLPALAAQFQWPGKGLPPLAAITRQQQAGDAGDGVWLFADLANVQPDLTGARMLACGMLDVTADEAEALAQPLRPLFGDRGVLLETTTPPRWHLRLPQGTRLPDFATPEAVLGDSLIAHLPEGDEGRRWRALLNEAQVILHQHPVNNERRRRGKPFVNSLWFWGAGGNGTLPPWLKCVAAQAYGDAPLLQALAAQAGVPVQPSAAFDPTATPGEDVLLDLGNASGAAATLALLRATLRRRNRLELAFADGERYRVRRSHRWRFWRGVTPGGSKRAEFQGAMYDD